MKYHSEQLNKGYLKEGYKLTDSKKDKNYYISELTKDGNKFYTIAGIKNNNKKTLVVAYSGFNKETFLTVYDNTKYNVKE